MSNQIQITSGAKVRALDGVITGTTGVLSSVPLGGANGVATLDSSGKVPLAQLPASVFEYKGTWNATTNTPYLVNGVGTSGWVYVVSVGGLHDFGAGSILFLVGDQVLYDGSIWERSSGATGTVTSVALTAPSAFNVSGSPITTSGTLAITGAGTTSQYINGAGSLTTFPSLTGFVPYTGATNDLNLATHNLFANNLFDGFTNVAASGTQIVLTIASTPSYTITGSGGQTIKLPDATTLPNGAIFSFNNNQSSGAITINNNSNTLVVSVPSGGFAEVVLLDNSIAAGSWDRHFKAPSNVSWSTNTLDYAGSITSATWNGNVVAINRGGTGSSTQNFVDLTTTQTIGGVKTFSSSLTASSLIKTGGTSSQFLKADGSVDSSSYITLASLSATSPLSYNNTTGAFSIQVANTSQSGYLSSTDWNTFNSKQSTLTFSSPLVNTSGTISIPAATSLVDGYLTSTNFSLFYNKQSQISLTTTGSSGSSTFIGTTLNIPTYTLSGLGGVPTSRTLTINGVGYDLSADRSWTITAGISSVSGTSPISVSTISGAATVSISQSTTSSNGYLSSTDWNTFNNKQNALTNPITGSLNSGYLPKSTGSTTLTDSGLYNSGNLFGIGQSSFKSWEGNSKLFEAYGDVYFGGLVNNDFHAGTNSYLNASTIWKFSDDGRATNYYQSNGVHGFRVSSVSGTLGSTITWLDAITIATNSDVTIGNNLNITNSLYVTSKASINTALSTESLKLKQTTANSSIIYAFTNGLSAGTSFGMAIEAGTNSSDRTFVASSQAGSEYFKVRGDGFTTINNNLSIGNTSNAYKLDVTGTFNVNYDGQTAIFQGSTRYFQINVRNTPNAGDYGIGLRSSSGSYISLSAGQNSISGLVVNEQGNLGVRTAANVSWTNDAKVLQLGDYPVIYADGSGAENLILASNSYYNGSNNIYTTSRATTRTIYESSTPTITHQVAVSGTASTTVPYQSIGIFNTTGFGVKTTPSTLFHTYSSTDNFSTFEAGVSGGIQIRFKHGSTQTAFINSNTSSIFSVYQSTGTEKLTLGSNGQLNYYQIGDAPITNSLYGNIIVNSDGSGYFSRIRFDVTTTPYWGLTRIATSNDFSISGRIGSTWSDNVFRIYQASGNVVIGATVSGGGLFQVNGDVNINGNFKINGTTIGGGGGSGVTGSGTTSYLPKWTSSSAIGNSLIYDNGTQVTIGGTTGSGRLNILGAADSTFYAQLQVKGTGSYPDTLTGILLNAGTAQSHLRFAVADTLKYQIRYNSGSTEDNYLRFYSFTQNSDQININATNGYVSLSNAANVNTGYKLHVDGSVNISGNFYINGTALSSGIGGSGTANYIPRFTSSTILTNSTMQDDGINATFTGGVNVNTYQNMIWKGVSSGYDFSMGNGGYGMYILSASEIDLNAPIGMRYGNIYTFKGNGSSAYNVNIFNSGVAADELQMLGGLKLNTTTCGFVPPKMTTTQKNALSSSVKVAGCIVYDTTSNLLQAWNGASWNNLW